MVSVHPEDPAGGCNPCCWGLAPRACHPAYFGREPTAAENGRMIIYKAMCDLLWTLWGLIQYADNNPAEDFWAYSTGRFDRCKLLMFGSDFQKHLDSVRD